MKCELVPPTSYLRTGAVAVTVVAFASCANGGASSVFAPTNERTR